MIRMDIVTVFHSDNNFELSNRLHSQILEHEPAGWRFITVDNRVDNRGFAKACNWGAFHPKATAPIIGFLNPDCDVNGPFMESVADALNGRVVITGCRFGKPDDHLRVWGCSDWVCGAAFFVRRKFFEDAGGFDEGFVWSWEETDLIRQAQQSGKRVQSIDLPITHAGDTETEEDAHYKHRNFELGRQRFARKWQKAQMRTQAIRSRDA